MSDWRCFIYQCSNSLSIIKKDFFQIWSNQKDFFLFPLLKNVFLIFLTVWNCIINKCLLVWFWGKGGIQYWVPPEIPLGIPWPHRRAISSQGHETSKTSVWCLPVPQSCNTHTLGNPYNMGACGWAAELISVTHIRLSICHANKVGSGAFIPKSSTAQEFIDARIGCNIMSVCALKNTEGANWLRNSSQYKHSENRDSRL